jgi:DNA-binding NtrC family response regulator
MMSQVERLPPKVASALFSMASVPDARLQDLLDRALDLAVGQTPSSAGGALCLLDRSNGKSAWSFHQGDGVPRHSRSKLAQELQGLLEEAPRARAGSLISDLDGETSEHLCLFRDSRSQIRVPILRDGASILGMILESLEEDAYRREHLDLLAGLTAWTHRFAGRLLLSEHAAEAGFDLRLVGLSPPLLDLEERLKRVASDPNSPALVSGERGSGKELAAYAIHFFSRRRQGPFVPVNCAAFSSNLFSDELFGHEKGAFTGAETPREGIFVSADHGTLFFDEVGDMSPQVQASLLRVLDHGKIHKIGEDRAVDVDVRIVAATNKNLEEMVARGEFRSDLYDRLNVFRIDVPPLRARKEDIQLLVDYFLRKACADNGRRKRWEHRETCQRCVQRTGSICTQPDLYRALDAHDYPGNVRELKNLMYRVAAMVVDEELDSGHLDDHMDRKKAARAAAPDDLRLDHKIKEHILEVLDLAGQNKSQAARLLGLPLTTLINKMKRLGIH